MKSLAATTNRDCTSRCQFLNSIIKFDARIQTLDSRPERFLTIEKKDVIVDSYAKWRINNAAQFFRSTGGDSARTARLLSERIDTSLRDEFGRRTIKEVVSEDRLELMQVLTKLVDTQAAELGVEVVDVRVKKIDLPPEVSESVYNRMRAERERVARDLRAKGSEAAERIRADADRQRTVTLADAYREAEETRGMGDAKASEIFAKAFQADPEFYAFYRSLNAYRRSFLESGSTLVLAPDSDFFKFFNQQFASYPPQLSSSDAQSQIPAQSSVTILEEPVQIQTPVKEEVQALVKPPAPQVQAVKQAQTPVESSPTPAPLPVDAKAQSPVEP